MTDKLTRGTTPRSRMEKSLADGFKMVFNDPDTKTYFKKLEKVGKIHLEKEEELDKDLTQLAYDQQRSYYKRDAGKITFHPYFNASWSPYDTPPETLYNLTYEKLWEKVLEKESEEGFTTWELTCRDYSSAVTLWAIKATWNTKVGHLEFPSIYSVIDFIKWYEGKYPIKLSIEGRKLEKEYNFEPQKQKEEIKK